MSKYIRHLVIWPLLSFISDIWKAIAFSVAEETYGTAARAT
ncbi:MULTISPECIES: hypothetical protein [Oceanobacillus]|nr:hypothetical protein [Oceanobacillus indicireducens]